MAEGMVDRRQSEGSYGRRIGISLVVIVLMTLVVASSLYTHTGRGAANIELARLAYTQTMRVVSGTEATLTSRGQTTAATPAYLSRAALDLDVSLVLFLETDTPLVVAHGPSLNVALGRLRDSDAMGVTDDSGQTPWIPRFVDLPDPERFPRRNGRIVRVQKDWPYAIEAPVAGNMTLRMIPLSVLQLKDGGYRSSLFVLFLIMSLASTLIALRLAKPLEVAAVGLERMASRGGPWSVPTAGLREIGWIARASTRMQQRVLDAETLQREVLRTLNKVLVEPMARIKTGIEQLSGTRTAPTQRETLSELESEITSLHRMVSALWQWNSLESGTLEANLQEVDLAHMLDEVVRIFTERRDIDLRVDISLDEEVEPTVQMDAALMASVVVALLDNVRLHGKGPVNVRVQRAQTKIQISLRDEGSGVSFDELNSIFQPFQQRGGKQTDGLGLGLHLSRLILALHKGGLSVRNHPSGGFEVSLWIPAPPVRVSAIDRSLLGTGWTQDASAAPPAPKENEHSDQPMIERELDTLRPTKPGALSSEPNVDEVRNENENENENEDFEP